MQFNQPINSGFQNEQFCPYYQPPLPYTNIIGEGNVVYLMFPDGNVQFLFIPTHRQDRRFYPYPYLGQVQGPIEAWLIRKISTPTIPNVMQESMPYGDPFLRSYYASKPNVDLVPQTPYYQKFHSDNVTSTTDIHYFFPRKTTLKHSAFVQVEHPAKYSICSQTDNVEKKCLCSKKTKMCEYTMIDSSSAMSIDDESQTTDKRKKNSRVRFKTTKSREHKKCSCKQSRDQGIDQSDKKTSTYTDQSVNCAESTSQNSQTPRKGSKSSLKCNLAKSNSQTSCDSCCRTCFHCVTDCTSDGFE